MAKKTQEAKYTDIDISRGVQRHYLSSSQDSKDIYYQYQPENFCEDAPQTDVSEKSQTCVESGAVGFATKSTQAITEIPIPTSQLKETVEPMPDAPISSTDIVRCIIGRRLKKHLEDVPIDKSIKELVSGKLLHQLSPHPPFSFWNLYA